jgi:hypothetical protein
VSDTLSEAAGCALLARLFREHGYTIRRNVLFKEYGVSFHVDGWDATQRVGFEFLSSEKEDHEDLTLKEFEKLKDAELRGELSLFIIDEVEPLSATVLRESAEAFLDDVARSRRQPGRGPTKQTASAAKGSVAKATRTRPTAVKKPAVKKPAVKKPAVKKRATTVKATTARLAKTGIRTTGAAKRPRKQAKPTGTRQR